LTGRDSYTSHCTENGFRKLKQTFVEEEEDVVVGDVVDVGDHLEFDVIQLGHVDGPGTASTATHRHGALLVRLADHRVRPAVGRKLHVTRRTGYFTYYICLFAITGSK